MKYTLLFPLKSFIICQQKKRIYTKTEEGKKKKKGFCYDLVDKDIHVVFQCLFLNSLQSMDITMFAGNL